MNTYGAPSCPDPEYAARTPGALLLLLLVSLLLITSGCVGHRMYRPVDPDDKKRHFVCTETEKKSACTLAFIELDDQGEFWSPAQLSATADLITGAPAGSVVLLFIHGWHNNASEKQEEERKTSLAGFKRFLGELAARRDKDNGKVIGVFVGWRGKAIKRPFGFLSFYTRKRAASRIAGAPAATEILLRVVRAAKSDENKKKRVILIGHSFGGLILERALAQVLVNSVQQKEEVSPPIDLAVLINTASSSIHSKQLVELFARRGTTVYRDIKRDKPTQDPLLVSITSRADWATRFAYPIGSALGATLTRFRKYRAERERCPTTARQRFFYVNTPGHRRALHSHVVTGVELYQSSDELGYAGDDNSFTFNTKTHRFTVEKKPRALNDTPYWIMQVPGSLISGHSDILRPDTNRLIEALLKHTGVEDPESKATMRHETGLRPIALIGHPSGKLLFADRSRGVYKVTSVFRKKATSVSIKREFLDCVPEVIDPDAAIGLFNDGDWVVVISNYEVERKDKKMYRTVRVRLLFSEDELRKTEVHQVSGSTRFVAATPSPDRQKIYLATKEGEIYVADLSQEQPKPEHLRVSFNGDQKIMDLKRIRFDASRKRLFALDEGGQLYLIDLKKDTTAEARLVATDLGKPTDMRINAISETEIYIYITEHNQILRLRCSDQCSEKEVFARSNKFKGLLTLALAPDRTVWVADARDIFAVSPDGDIFSLIEEEENRRDKASAIR